MKEVFLNRLRDKDLPIGVFRETTLSLSKLMASEVALKLGENQKIILISILRAGLVLMPAFEEKFRGAPIGLFGIRRDEKTAIPHLYYEKLPPITSKDLIILLDPMLATGGTANLALNRIKKLGGKECMLISIISAPEGSQLIKKEHPKVFQYTVAMDKGLDEKKFIIPGLGDFGDRYFGTV